MNKALIPAAALIAIALGGCSVAVAVPVPPSDETNAMATDPGPPAFDPQVSNAEGRLVYPNGWQQRTGDILHIESGGLSFGQPGLHPANLIAFELPREVAVAAVTRIRGRPTETGRNSDCGAGPVDYTAFGPLRLNFQNDRFVGWTLDRGATPAIETDLGFGIGAARADVLSDELGPGRISRTTLGVEFDWNGIGGFLSNNRASGRVISLYAGVTCFYR